MRATTASGGASGRGASHGHRHATPFYCPYCGEENIRPAGDRGGVWECGDCRRTWALRTVSSEEVSTR